MINRLMKNVDHSSKVPPITPGRNNSAMGEPASFLSLTTRRGKAARVGAMRRMIFWLPSRPLSTSQRSDSGSASSSTGTSSSGKAPPSISTPRQPIRCSSCADARPPSAEPMVKPQNIMVTRPERRCCGQYSDVMVTEVGMAPPRPSPVKKRSTSSIVRSVDQADSRLAVPKKATETISTGRRP